ncbi:MULTISPECIES: vWA domain-containing protein [unclassified Agarivorans]|uniref:vWA domain-containing protein n=1 Tax=unclassified Agarivorans TaxID=2636026 RepID=UPI003D7E132B
MMQFSSVSTFSPVARAVGLVLAVSALVACGQYSDTQAEQSKAPVAPTAEPLILAEDAAIPRQRLEQAAAVQQLTRHAKLSSQADLRYVSQIQSLPKVSNQENYQVLEDSTVHLVSEQPVSTFSADVDTASYANVRRFINQGQMPPKAAVRVEELLNYFSYDYLMPHSLTEAQPIAANTLLTASPWNPNNHLLRIGINSYQPDIQQRPAANLVFLVDVSGSMQSSDKLTLAKQSMSLMLSQLKADDSVAIVTYASGTSVALPATKASSRLTIERAIDSLRAGGATNGEAGIALAYQQAQQGFISGGINQVYLISDGDLNVGVSDVDALKHLIGERRKAGVQFSTLGFGQGNYNDYLMEQLADTGNGVSAYIDTLHEAQKVLVDQLGSSLYTVAHDVKFQVEFNPAQVLEYRLLGYQNRQLERADFNNDQKDAGDIGAGHSVTAIYELTLVGDQGLIDPLVFQSASQAKQASAETSPAIAELRLRYKTAHSKVSAKRLQRVHKADFIALSKISDDDRFALAVAAFGQKLTAAPYLGDVSYQQIIDWANQAKGKDNFGYRAEFVKLVRLTFSLAQQNAALLDSHSSLISQPPGRILPARNQAQTYELSQ